MGGPFGALGQIGEATASAEEIRRRRAIEDAFSRIQQRYAETNLMRSQVEMSREKRLEAEAKLPRFLGFQTVMGVPVAAMQDAATGKISWERIPGAGEEAGLMLSEIEDTLSKLPANIQGEVRSGVTSRLRGGDIKGALAWLDSMVGKDIEAQIPKPAERTVSESKEDITGKKRTVTTKEKIMPARPGAPAAPSGAATPPATPLVKQAPTPVAATLTSAWGNAKRAGFTLWAPSPAYYEASPDGKVKRLRIPSENFQMIEQYAESVANGTLKIPATGNAAAMQRWGLIQDRAREKGWTGGPPPTNSERDAAQWARAALEHMGRVRELVMDLSKEGQLGPMMSRINHALTYGYGADEDHPELIPETKAGQLFPRMEELQKDPNYPKYVELASTLALMATALMRAHVGARGGVRLLDEFTKQWDPSKMSGMTLMASLNTMESFLHQYTKLDQTRTTPGDTQMPKMQFNPATKAYEFVMPAKGT